MKIRGGLLCLILFLLLICEKGICQNSGSGEDLSDLFDDGGFSTAKNVLKINLTSIYVGDLSVFFERALTKNLSIEAGVGLLLPYYNSEFFGLHNLLYEELPNPKGGLSFWLNPKFYITDAPLQSYFGFLFRRRNYEQYSGGELQFSDYAINGGFQMDIFERLVIDYNLGIGFRTMVSSQRLEKDFTIIMPLTVKLGYLF